MKRILSLGLALLVIGASLLSLTACSSSGDEEIEVQTTLEAVYTESAVPVEKSSEEILNYFNSLLNGIKTERPAMYYRFEKNVPNGSLKVTKAGQEEAEEIDSSLSAINDAAKAVKDLMLENIEEKSGDLAFGADNTDVLLVKGESFASKLTIDNIKYATLVHLKADGDSYEVTDIDLVEDGMDYSSSVNQIFGEKEGLAEKFWNSDEKQEEVYNKVCQSHRNTCSIVQDGSKA